MKIIKTKDYNELSATSADVVISEIRKNKNAVLGLATGSTPIGMYDLMIKACRDGLSYRTVKTLNLDEYVGLGADSPDSYVSFMRDKLFEHIDIDMKNTHLPDGKAADMQAECARYSALIKSMPRDVQVLGLGRNGHIGFNEPGTPFDSVTHVVRLTDDTVEANARLFACKDDVPRYAVTMGIAEIMQAKKIILLASGAGKAQAVYAAARGKITETCPASVLQNHPDVILIADEEAHALL